MTTGGKSETTKKFGAKDRRVLVAVAVLIIAGAGISIFGESLRDYLFGKPPEAPAARFGYLRLPIDGEQFAYQTMRATQRPEAPRLRRSVRVKKGDTVEFGVIRLAVEFGEPCDYVFSAHALIDGARVKLCETSEGFPVNRWRVFRAELDVESEEAKEIELEYSIRPDGIRERLDAAMAGALGLALGGPRKFSQATINESWIGKGSARASHLDIRRALYLFAVACLINGAWVGGLTVIRIL